MADWVDLDARVRGLSSRLLGGARLQSLANAPDFSGFVRELRDSPYGESIAMERPSAADIDLAIRRTAARHLGVVSRWARHRRQALLVIFEDEDRRSLSALVRGAAAGVATGDRLAGLLPTPTLPERALEALAQQPTAGAIAALLVAWGNPYGSAVLAAAMRAKPDLLGVELALDALFVSRAGAAAGRNRALRDYVAEVIDLENICAALVLAEVQAADSASDTFRPGGRYVTRQTFLRAVAIPGAPAAMELLEADILHPLWARVLREASGPASVERAALRGRVRAWRARAIMAPVGAEPILYFVLRLRAEALDLRAIAWSYALGVRSTETGAMVSV
jgi:vacuolar-type H+-ATPase subunit C/Vma6